MTRKVDAKRRLPPALVFFEGPDHLVARGTFSIDTIWINEGGEGRGVRIALWGLAVDEGRIALTRAILGPREAERSVELVTGRSDAGLLAGAEAGDWVLGAAFERKEGPVTDNELLAIASSMVSVRIEGAVRRPGRTALHVSVCPLGAAEGDVLSLELDLHSAPGLRVD